MTTPTSTVCTALGSCVSVVMDTPNHFAFSVTCTARESIGTGVRGFFADGNWSTSSARLVNCTVGAKVTFSRTYRGPLVVAHKAYLGTTRVTAFGNYAGAAVPPGGHETGVSSGGFHWD